MAQRNRERKYRYYVKPKGDEAKQAVSAMLDDLGHSADTCLHEEITVEVKTKRGSKERLVRGVFEFPDHPLLDEIKHSQWLYEQVEVFVQEGAGKIRPYGLFTRNPAAVRDSEPYRDAEAWVEEMRRTARGRIDAVEKRTKNNTS